MAVGDISALTKGTRLLDELAGHGEAMPLSVLASASALPQATAARLLRTLEHLGWVDHAGRRGGYRLGPRVRALGLAQRHRQRLFAAATLELPRLADVLGAPVTVSVLRGGRRCLLHQWAPAGGELHPVLDERDDVWSTASGRLLVARLGVAARQRLLSELGVPLRGTWPGVFTREDVCAELAWIRRRNLAVMRPRGERLAGAATGVEDGEGGLVAVGFYAPSGDWDPVRVERLAAAVEALARRLGGGSRSQRERAGRQCTIGQRDERPVQVV